MKDRGSLRNRVNMRNKETRFKISGSGFIHSNTHLQKAINTITIRLRDTERETVHKAHRSRDLGREN